VHKGFAPRFATFLIAGIGRNFSIGNPVATDSIYAVLTPGVFRPFSISLKKLCEIPINAANSRCALDPRAFLTIFPTFLLPFIVSLPVIVSLFYTIISQLAIEKY